MNDSNSSDEQDLDQLPRQSCLYLKACLNIPQHIGQFFYYLNADCSYIVAKYMDKVFIFNTVTKVKELIDVGSEDYVLAHQLPPYLFTVFRERWIQAYRVGEKGVEKPDMIRVSKMEPRSMARFNKGCFLGGYNRSALPGNRRTSSREIYFMGPFKLNGKNKPEYTIKLNNSDCPVSHLQVQNPLILAYCHPVAYLISIASKEVVITVQKDAVELSLLQGRYAMSLANGIGISSKNKLFTFDVERYPVYGVQLNQHKSLCEKVVMDRTGRVFCSRGSTVFEYNLILNEEKLLVVYPEGEWVAWLVCTKSNNLMVSRRRGKILSIDVFMLE